jgi:hypothetical protein
VLALLLGATGDKLLVALGFILLFKDEIASVVGKLKEMKWLKSGPISAAFRDEDRNQFVQDISSVIAPPSLVGPPNTTETDIAEHRPIPVASKPVDIDGDGIDELVVVSQDGPYWSTLRVYRFSAPDSYPGNARFVEIANLSGILNWKIRGRLNANPLIVVDIDDPDSTLPHAANDNLVRKTFAWMDGELTLLNEERLMKSYTTYEMSQGAAREIAELLVDKNSLIDEVLKRTDSNHELQRQVVDADMAFSVYLDCETSWHYTYWSDGSIRSIAASAVKKRLLSERIKILEDWLNRDEGDMW